MANLSFRSAQEIENAKAIRQQLIEMLGEDEPEVIADTLEGEVDLEGVATEILVSIDEDEMIINGITERKRALDIRSGRAKSRIERKRDLLVQVLEIANKQKMTLALATLSLGKGTDKLADFDEAKVPPKFFITPDPVVDKKALLAALKGGAEFDGIYLANKKPSLSIRKA